MIGGTNMTSPTRFPRGEVNHSADLRMADLPASYREVDAPAAFSFRVRSLAERLGVGVYDNSTESESYLHGPMWALEMLQEAHARALRAQPLPSLPVRLRDLVHAATAALPRAGWDYEVRDGGLHLAVRGLPEVMFVTIRPYHRGGPVLEVPYGPALVRRDGAEPWPDPAHLQSRLREHACRLRDSLIFALD